MPNGGYPMHFLARVGGTEFAIHAQGANVELVRDLSRADETAVADRPRWEKVGNLTERQITGLLYHLRYWGGGKSGSMFNGRQVSPQYGAVSCEYDY